ncbi:hypothetical protein HELRODRAFT_85381, partial [Helobdella robusta]|uniref:Alpha-1,3-mannosyl-glycoprotein 2-beta-N-acetylglucosaminyltransferase n=1 Tax=Helobdella robusta TaxID=6412 RepID=T1G5W2_HELRO
VIPVLVMACNRPSVNLIINRLLLLRPSLNFPVIVSQDCSSQPTTDVIKSFGDKIVFMQQPDLSDFKLPQRQDHMQGYYKIARHYRWALNQVFRKFKYKSVIIVEDDLEISDDFFEFFSASYIILKSDPTLWCVSAWNDNGKDGLVDEDGGDLLYRTDFFPGLGWMMTADVWSELEPKWPITFWDDWMRNPEQRKGRACIRPEVPRTSTFGKIGVSKGQYFDKHLKYIKHFKKFVRFTELDLSYLLKENYDGLFTGQVYSSHLINFNDLDDVASLAKQASCRIEYNDEKEFIVIAKKLSIMDDFKSNIPRMSYLGIVSVVYHKVRIFVCPRQPTVNLSTPPSLS